MEGRGRRTHAIFTDTAVQLFLPRSYFQAEHSAGELRLCAGHLDVHVHHLRLLRPPRIRRRPLVSERAMMAGQCGAHT